jgi:hypothetical protein
MIMKTKFCRSFAALALLTLAAFNLQLSTAHAQGTAFTYQGRLNSGGSPASGLYDFVFSLSNAPSGGSQVGGSVTNLAVGVTNGLFTTSLDFGAVFTGNPTWLAISVRTNGVGSYIGLNPLQQLEPTPYAIYSANAGAAASANSVSAANIVGIIPAAQLPASVITNGASGVNITGTFSGNGAGVTNVPFGSLNDSGYISWGNFSLSSSPGVGGSPLCVIAADVKGDGQVDLISALAGAGALTVLTNNGFGVFGSNATLAVGIASACVIAADVNGDGHVDLIIANCIGGGVSGNTLTVLTNNGYGVFGFNATLTVGIGPNCVIAADVNGDGHVDLICANAGLVFDGNTLTVLTNNGFGVFGSNATLTVGSQPVSVIAADVNGDGRVDLISANSGDNTLTVLTNNGFGGFGYNATLTVGNQPDCVIAADVNGDGHVDLICASYEDNTLTVLTNNGLGAFGLNAVINAGNNPNCVIAADVNGDGHVDLICASSYYNTLTVLTNNGYGVFGLNATLKVGNGPVCVFAADVNGDGRVDLICANAGDNTLSDNTLSVLLNTPAYHGTFSGNGSGLTALNAANLTGSIPAGVSVPAGNLTGTLPATVFPTNLVLAGGLNLDHTGTYGLNPGTVSSNALSFGTAPGGSGEGIASKRVGTGPYDLEFFTGNVNRMTINNFGDLICYGSVYANGTFFGNGSGLSSLNASQLTGVIPQSVLPSFQSSDNYDTVGGGYGNSASATFTTVGGGSGNSASGNWATVGGGTGNSASGGYSTIPGGANNVASGQDSFAAGNNSHATDNGSFVWGDGTRGSTSQGSNTFCVLATGGVYCYTLISGASPYGAYLAKNSTAWSAISDRNAKKNFQPVDAKAVLDKLAAIPISEWNYKWEKDSDVPNIGPMAQDFKHAFYPGRDDKGITTLEFDGVELAAIQGLNQKLEIEAQAKDTEIQTLKQQNDLLAERLNELEATVKTITERK